MISRLVLVTILLAGAVSAAAQQEPPVLRQLVSGPVCAAYGGNGRLTFGVSDDGRLSVLRWPSPGGPNQVSELPAADAAATAYGAMWGVQIGQETLWLAVTPWSSAVEYVEGAPSVVQVKSVAQGRDFKAGQTIAVHPSHDVLALRLAVTGIPADAEPRVLWFADFSPATQRLPAWPTAHRVLGGLTDFAAYADTGAGRVWHLRPESPGTRDNQRLEEAAADSALWNEFGDGVWIACAAGGNATAACGNPAEMWGLPVGEDAGKTRAMAAGDCASLLSIEPDRTAAGIEAVVYIALGEDRDSADEALTAVTQQGFGAVVDEARAAGAAQLATMRVPSAADYAVADLARRALTLLMAATDSESGAVVRSPAGSPPGVVMPADSAWAIFAWDHAGAPERAEAHLRFCLDTLETTSSSGRPEGSMPSAIYPNGKTAAPRFVIQPEAAAAVLWAAAQHVKSLSPEASTAFLEKTWKQMDAAGAFLATWKDPHGTEPLYSFDCDRLRDTRSLSLLFSLHSGLAGAVTLADAAVHPRPEWNARRNELRDLIVTQCFSEEGAWTVDDVPRHWPLELYPYGDPRWDAVTEPYLARSDGMPADAALNVLNFAALTRQGRPDALARLETPLKRVLAEVLAPRMAQYGRGPDSPPWPDAYLAAMGFTALAQVYPLEQTSEAPEARKEGQ